MKLLTFVLMCFGISSSLASVLPSDFRLQSGPQGPTLTWSSETVPIHVGGSRFEFRFEDGTVLGYPRVQRDALQLSLSSFQFQALTAQKAARLQVWSSGRRIDTDVSLNVFRSSQFAPASSSTLSTPTVPTDPAKKGTLVTGRRTYSVAPLNITGFSVPIEVVGEVTFPKSDPTKHPLILFLHGRRSPCYQDGADGEMLDEWPCPEGWLSIPSYKGFRYVADILASQGYTVVSVSANAINAYDYYDLYSNDTATMARSALIRHHLSLWAQWNANGGSPFGNTNKFKGRLDMNQVVLVGHQRGGQAVHRAAIDASPSDPYKIVGLVTYGATAYGRQVTPDVYSVNILPTCGGDVYDLQGQLFVDASRDIADSEALRSAVISIGSNDFYFNTEWTPGVAVAPAYDDYWSDDDPICGSQGGGNVRLTADEQRKVGATYTAALIKLATYQDVSMLPLLDGSFVRPAAIGRAEISTNAVGGANYRLIYRPEDGGLPIFRNGMTGQECHGNYWIETSIPLCEGFFSPHWPHDVGALTRPSPQALQLQWNGNQGAIAQFKVRNAIRNFTSLDSLIVRIANDPEKSGVSFDLMIADKQGNNATLQTNLTTIEGWPTSPDQFARIHARTLRGSLASVQSSSSVNLGRITDIFLVTRSASGRVWVLDIAASQSRIQVPTVLNLPKLSLETSKVNESNGLQKYNLKIISDRPLTSKGSVWVEERNYYGGVSGGYKLNLNQSSSTLVGQIAINNVADDNIFSSPVEHIFSLEAIKGVVTGGYVGSLTIVDDEPTPVVSVVQKKVAAPKGQWLDWTVKLSTRTSLSLLSVSLVAPSNATELTSHDVPTSWLRHVGLDVLPSNPTPLSELYLAMPFILFEFGSQTAHFLIPLSKDGPAKGGEVIVLHLYTSLDGLENDKYITLTGTVLPRS